VLEFIRFTCVTYCNVLSNTVQASTCVDLAPRTSCCFRRCGTRAAVVQHLVHKISFVRAGLLNCTFQKRGKTGHAILRTSVINYLFVDRNPLMSACACTRTHTHLHTQTHTCTHVCAHVNVHAA